MITSFEVFFKTMTNSTQIFTETSMSSNLCKYLMPNNYEVYITGYKSVIKYKKGFFNNFIQCFFNKVFRQICPSRE